MSEFRNSSAAVFLAGAGVVDSILNIGELPLVNPANQFQNLDVIQIQHAEADDTNITTISNTTTIKFNDI